MNSNITIINLMFIKIQHMPFQRQLGVYLQHQQQQTAFLPVIYHDTIHITSDFLKLLLETNNKYFTSIIFYFVHYYSDNIYKITNNAFCS